MNNFNACPDCTPAPDRTLKDKLTTLNELITAANDTTSRMEEILFGPPVEKRDNIESPINCMNAELDVLVSRMADIVNRMNNIYGRIV